jgi:protein-S-isoprenylcysteine O-methyltransferase Ste14
MEDSEVSAHEKVPYKTSDFLGVVHLATSLVLQRALPLQGFDHVLSRNLRIGFGSVLLMAGAFIIRTVHAELAKHGQPHQPGKPTTKLVNSGIFQISRNPKYFACVAFFVPATALLCNNLWMLILMPLDVPAFHYLLIRPEEEYLLARFLEEYKRYCLEVNRWFRWRGKG